MKRFGLLAGLVVVLGCGGASSLLNLIPLITGLGKHSVAAGTGGFILDVVGDNFLPGAKVMFNGQERDTIPDQNGDLNASILATDVETPGTYPVLVKNPDGSESDPVEFKVLPTP